MSIFNPETKRAILGASIPVIIASVVILLVYTTMERGYYEYHDDFISRRNGTVYATIGIGFFLALVGAEIGIKTVKKKNKNNNCNPDTDNSIVSSNSDLMIETKTNAPTSSPSRISLDNKYPINDNTDNALGWVFFIISVVITIGLSIVLTKTDLVSSGSSTLKWYKVGCGFHLIASITTLYFLSNKIIQWSKFKPILFFIPAIFSIPTMVLAGRNFEFFNDDTAYPVLFLGALLSSVMSIYVAQLHIRIRNLETFISQSTNKEGTQKNISSNVSNTIQ